VKWGRGKREANGEYCKCEEMRFVIRNLVDVDEVSPTTAPEILPDGTVKAPEILLC
jgi:hypothetical protein